MSKPNHLPPAARLVLLGASNLRRSLPTVLRVGSEQVEGPFEVFVAHGHGRSYGQRSRVLGRTLPGILSCQLWNDLNDRPSLPIFALLTDIGNDLLYGVEPTRLLQWVDECIVRLLSHDVQIVVTQLPIESILGLSRFQYKVFRNFFFPRSRLSLETITERARTTNEGLIKLAKRYEIAVPNPLGEWFGIDSIHLRRRSFGTAWRALLRSWGDGQLGHKSIVFPWKQRVALEIAVPRERNLFGFTQTRIPPSLRLEEGSTIALY